MSSQTNNAKIEAVFCPLCLRTTNSAKKECPLDGTPLKEIPESLPQRGSTLSGNFLILEEIGSGGMGAIYRAFDIKHKRDVALKVLKPHFVRNEQIVNRFFTEARAAKQLNHPNIVATYDFGVSTQGYLFISMEYLGGTTLSKELARKGRFPAEKALMIALSLAESVSHAHESGVVHRDLKPENIILLDWDTDYGFVKVFDFGIAALLNGNSCTRPNRNEVLGTPAYMSPEQVRGEELDSRSDLYSLGILLFEMLAGYLPFYSNDPYETMKRHLTEEIPALPAISAPHHVIEQINSLLRELLRKDPSERMASASILKERISEILACFDGDSQGFLSACVRRKKEDEKFLPFHSRKTIEVAQPVYLLNEQPTLILSNSDAIHELQTLIMSNHNSPTIISVQCGFCGAMNYMIMRNCVNCRRPLSKNGLIGSDTPPMPWTVSARAGVDIEAKSRDFTLVTLLHVDLQLRNDNGDTDNFLRMLAPEIDAWSGLVLAQRGVVCFNTGKEVRAVFGLFGSNGSFAKEAIAAAINLRWRILRFRNALSIPIIFRAGISTAPVPRSCISLTSTDLLLRGSRVDIATRLARIAPEDSVAIDSSTASLTNSNFSFTSFRDLAVRGSWKTEKTLLLIR